MARYRNPANGYSESVTVLSLLGAFTLGPIWYAWQGLWAHLVVQLLLFILFSGVVLLWPLIIVVWLGYTLAAPFILARSYLRRGWQRV